MSAAVETMSGSPSPGVQVDQRICAMEPQNEEQVDYRPCDHEHGDHDQPAGERRATDTGHPSLPHARSVVASGRSLQGGQVARMCGQSRPISGRATCTPAHDVGWDASAADAIRNRPMESERSA